MVVSAISTGVRGAGRNIDLNKTTESLFRVNGKKVKSVSAVP